MRFQVPQFIEIEDKIFGPLTFKQFIYVVGGAGIIVLLFFFLPNFIAFILSFPVAVFSGSLAFYKINNRPFIITVEAAIKLFFKNKLYVWKKKESQGYFSESVLSTDKKETSGSLKDKNFMLGIEEGVKESSNEKIPKKIEDYQYKEDY
jgi:hypothetical protein